jgi:predicted O-methyltransferase YrrM
MNTGEFFSKVESLYPDWQYDHPRLLYSLIKLTRPLVCVEVGTYLGYGACYMARALQENGSGSLTCIDCWQLPNPAWRHGSVRDHFESNLKTCGVRDLVRLIEGKSDEVVWPEKIDFAYIDGWHSYQTTKHDFLKCQAAGASCICFDDAVSVIGPRMVVDEIKKDPAWQVIQLPSAAGLAICQRVSVISALPITFSQELKDNPGVVVNPSTIQSHCTKASLENGVNYSGIT